MMTTADESQSSVLLLTSDARVRESFLSAEPSEACFEACPDEESAFGRLAERHFDLILLDSELPEISAWRFAERLHRERPGIALALLTDAHGSGAEELRDEWGVDVLHRSLPQNALSRAIGRLLEARRLDAENRRLRDSVHLLQQCRLLPACLEPGKVYPVALDLLLETLSRSRGAALFQRSSIPDSESVAFRGLGDEEARRLRDQLLEEKPLADDNAGGADELPLVEVVEGGPILSLLQGAGLSVERVLAVPLRGRSSESGTIWIFEDGREFSEQEIERANVVASHADLALENCEHYNQAKERAFIDDVTEVYNARYLLATTENEIRRAERYNHNLSVLFLDLDRFKLVNDRYGHLVGSHTLRNLSQVLMQCVRDVDTLARYGGDEFTILLVDTDHAEALNIAERIRRTVEDTVFEAGREGSLRLTVSVGVGTYPEHGRDRNALLDAADKAMYRAKSLGRNRICSSQEIAEGIDASD